MVKEILCALLEHVYTQCTHSQQEIFRQQKMHWQFRLEVVKHTLSNAWQQPWGTELYQYQTLWTVPSAWLLNTLLTPYQAKKGVGESTQAMPVLYIISAKRHCQMLVLGTVTKPKSSPLTGVQYVSMHCVLILVLGFITLKRTTQVKYWK